LAFPNQNKFFLELFLVLLRQICEMPVFMRKTLLFLGFCLLMLEGAIAQSALEYRLEEGDIFTVEQQAEQLIVQSLEGTTHQLTNRISGVLEFRVLKEQDSSYLLEFKFKDLIFQIESSLQGVLLDIHASEPDATDLQSRIFSAMLDVPVQMELNRKGRILAVSGGDSLVARVVREAELPDSFSQTMMRKSLEQQYGSNALAESYEQMTYFYPNHPVQVGGTWENRFEGKLRAQNIWHLDGMDTDTTLISGSASIEMEMVDTSSSMKLTGKQTSSIQANPNNGFLREMRVDSQAEGYSLTAQTGDLKIPTTITSNVIYRLIDHKKHVQ
jgi:hypothetical protein